MRRLFAVLALSGLVATGCSSDVGKKADDRLQVAAAAYPFAWLTEQVGGDLVEVTNLVKPGAEPHDAELSPRQVAQVQDTKLLVYLKGFQPAIDDALGDGQQGLDLGRVVGLRGADPHIWLDPIRMQTAATAVAAQLAKVDPAHATEYQAQGVEVAARLGELDKAFTIALRRCERHELVTSHSAFGYLAARYGLVQYGISGLSPDAEPSPGRMAEVATLARQHGVTTVFFESLVDPKVARTLASEVGAATGVLDPVEGVQGRDDYISVQLRNAAALRRALDCH